MAGIRSRKDGDLPTCIEIIKAVYYDSGYPVSDVDRALEELQTDGRAWWYNSICVLCVPSRRRLLILALVKDQDAIRLYRRLGWQHYGTTVFRWGESKEMDAECFVSPLS
ncbi:acyl-CoA N-acyltransferase [Xylaria castorea]|nr:acyl-CoA N-acyltransferase [Xylaria castorea]